MANSEWSPLAVRYLCMYHVKMVLPAVYDDELSYMEVLAKVQKKINELIAGYNNLNQWQSAQDEVMNELTQQVNDFINGGYREDFDQFVNAWLDANMEDALAQATRMVFFGLTEDGYFCAYVPSQWSFAFDTVMNYDSPDFGKLVILY